MKVDHTQAHLLGFQVVSEGQHSDTMELSAKSSAGPSKREPLTARYERVTGRRLSSDSSPRSTEESADKKAKRRAQVLQAQR